VVVLHVTHELLPSLIVILEDTIDLSLKRLLRGLLLAIGDGALGARLILPILVQDLDWIYLDLLLMDVLLESSLIVIPLVEVVISSNPFVLFLLLHDVVFGLLHVNENFFELFILNILLCLKLLALNVAANDIFRQCKLLDLEVDDCPSYLHGLSDCWGEWEPPSH
jgi:hypothetical protein